MRLYARTVLPPDQSTVADLMRERLESLQRRRANRRFAGSLGGETRCVNTHSGSCLCAAVRFEVRGDFDRFYLCHCQHCRKDTGSAHAANLFSGTAVVRWISGQDKVTRFTLPATQHSKSFCSICGSALPGLQMGGTLLAVPAGSLNTDVPIRPDAHIFTSSRATWDQALEMIPSAARFPQ